MNTWLVLSVVMVVCIPFAVAVCLHGCPVHWARPWKTMAIKYHCRCRHCQARQTRLKHPVRDYIRGPRCRGCGRVNTLRVDKWMQNRWRTYRTCLCDAYWFPHRQGSLYCYRRANGEVRQYGDADFRDRYLEISPA